MELPQTAMQSAMIPVPRQSTSTAAASAPIGALGALSSFHLFPQLPPELRIIVWMMYEGRVIPIIPGPANSGNFYTPPHIAPTVLQVNREARSLTQRLYKLVDLAPYFDGTSARPIWIDFSKDTIHLIQPGSPTSTFSAHCIQFLRLHVPDLRGVRHLSILEQHFEDIDRLFYALPMMESVTIIRNNSFGHVGEVVNGMCTMRQEGRGDFYLARSAIDDNLEEGVRRYQSYDAWISFWEAYCPAMDVKIRFCDIVQGDDRRDERVETGEGLKEMKKITLDDFVRLD